MHGKTGACGFAGPNTDLGFSFCSCQYSQNMINTSFELVNDVYFAAEGFFAAVGTEDWLDGFACGTCAEVSYR